MIAIDVGNTKTAIGLFEGETLQRFFRIATSRHRLKDEYLMVLRQLLPAAAIPGARLVVASVVPTATREIAKLAGDFDLVLVGHATPKSFEIGIENPQTLGADRIADSEAATRLYGAPSIVVAAGTATTVGAIDSRARFLGGSISPGLGIATDALFKAAAALGQVKIEVPASVVGHNTETAIQSGTALGHAYMIQGLVEGFKRAIPAEKDWKVIVTGGAMDAMAGAFPKDYVLDPYLTLKGLRLLGENRG